MFPNQATRDQLPTAASTIAHTLATTPVGGPRMTDEAGCEPSLADVQGECVGWHCWRGLSGAYYARQAHHPPRSGYQIRAKDPAGLREQIHSTDNQDNHLPVIPFGVLPASSRAGRRQRRPGAA